MEASLTDSLETTATISVRDLRVNYGEREILHGISFDVNRGETLVIRLR
jgi:phospholipid/cholesterol/gamma-HCH transport system ATP-binding protein